MGTYKQQVFDGIMAGLTNNEIADKYDMNIRTVRTTQKRLGLRPNKPAVRRDVRQLIREGWGFREIDRFYDQYRGWARYISRC